MQNTGDVVLVPKAALLCEAFTVFDRAYPGVSSGGSALDTSLLGVAPSDVFSYCAQTQPTLLLFPYYLIIFIIFILPGP